MSAQWPKLEVRFHMDVTGIYMDPFEPIHLDGLVFWCLASVTGKNEPPKEDQKVPEIFDQDYIGMLKAYRKKYWCWWASALFPGSEPFMDDFILGESVMYWRKRTQDLSRMHLVNASGVTPTMGTFRDYNMPCPMIHVRELRAWVRGDKEWLESLLFHVKGIGKKVGSGFGKVSGVEVVHSKKDYGIQCNGLATRYVPFTDQESCPKTAKLVRPRPPYWNLTERVLCSRIGEPTA